MNPLSSDTTPEAERVRLARIRQMSATEKLAAVDAMTDLLRTLALSRIRQRYPDATPEEVRRLLAEQILGPELARKVYGDAG
jgi:hypothetical protein